MKKTTVYDCSMVEMDKHHHETGNITVIENGKTIPFDVKKECIICMIYPGVNPRVLMHTKN